ncbi:MAG: transcription factor E [Candidatus Heimdallarchaeota archaeon]|nr:transcription factor E [Candidatus Heimdallarchaeota archaeon]MCK4769886.1 transcription factor E [Candidatus Heimdallarchaeota archaeon]
MSKEDVSKSGDNEDVSSSKMASKINISERQRQTLIEVVDDIAGEEVKQVTLVLLNADEETTDEEISEKLDMRLNQVRKSLYKLYDLQLATFRRIRDKSTGWFVYFWTLHPERIDMFVEKKQQEVLEKLQSRLDYEESNMFFTCNNPECPRVIFQEAMDQNFECGRCGGRLEAFDNEQLITVLKEKIVELEEIKNKTQKIMKGEK